MVRAWTLVCASAAIAVLACSAAGAAAEHITPLAPKAISAGEGSVTATLDFREGSDEFGDPTFADLELLIARSGTIAYRQPVTSRGCEECELEVFAHAPAPLSVQNLEGNAQPVVVLRLYTGGEHCCTIVQLFSFDPAILAYRPIEHDFGDAGALVTDVDGDGTLELRSADDRFAYAFTSFAYSGLPVQIWRLTDGALHDVTSEFPLALAADAARQLRAFRANRHRGLGLGFLAAWAADEDLLGRAHTVSATLAREARAQRLRSADRLSPSGAAFVRKLRRFLQGTGYAG